MENEGLVEHVPVQGVGGGNATRRAQRRGRAGWRAAAALATAFAVLAVPALAEADVGLVNQERAAAGLAPVVEDGALASLAQQHSAQMAATANLVHTANLGGAVGSVIPSYTGAAENVGQGPSVATVTSLFMASPTHRSAILGNFDSAGVGVATSGDGRVWVTQLFARRGGGAQVLSNTVTRPAVGAAARSACRTQTRRTVRRVNGRRVTRVVRSRRCTRTTRRAKRRRSIRRSARRR